MRKDELPRWQHQADQYSLSSMIEEIEVNVEKLRYERFVVDRCKDNKCYSDITVP